jgi:CheY-like chemotaxis protein
MSERQTKILVVEDEAVVLHTLQLILKQHGYQVKGACDGAEALAAVDFRPDILLCDINLPDMDGIQIALALKKQLGHLRVVLLSGEISSTELLQNAEEEGYRFEVLAKPTDPEKLLQILGESRGGDPSGIHRVK